MQDLADRPGTELDNSFKPFVWSKEQAATE